jgi:hypothetical protein
MPEWLSDKNIGQMHFYERDRDPNKCITKRNAGVSEGTGIKNDRFVMLAGCVNGIDQHVFSIGLQTRQRSALQLSRFH